MPNAGHERVLSLLDAINLISACIVVSHVTEFNHLALGTIRVVIFFQLFDIDYVTGHDSTKTSQSNSPGQTKTLTKI